jgi:L-glutamine-phosphate cytidylyltransferase
VPLVRHQMRALARVGIHDVTIVVGYEQAQVRASVGSAARYVINGRYAQNNSMCSFLLARQSIDDDVVVMNSDLFCHPGLPAHLIEVDGDALLYDSGSGSEAEEMKVRVSNGYLVEMSKNLPEERSCGENVGMLRLSLESVQRVADMARAIEAGGGGRAWLAAAVNCLALDQPIRCIDVAGWPWVEIDFPEDLARARAIVLPSVAEALGESVPKPEPALLRSVS